MLHVRRMWLCISLSIIKTQSTAYKVRTRYVYTQWNLSVEDTLNKGHLSNEDTACSPNYKTTSELGTPLYTGQPAESQWCPPYRGSTVCMYVCTILYMYKEYIVCPFNIRTYVRTCLVTDSSMVDKRLLGKRGGSGHIRGIYKHYMSNIRNR